MIRLLHEQDRAAAVRLTQESPVYNLYILGNIDAVGFDRPFCQFWGDVAPDGSLRAIVNRYMTGWVIFGRPGADWAGLAALMDHHEVQPQRLQDNPGGIPSWLPFLRRYQAAKVDEARLMALDEGDFRPAAPPPGVRVRRAVLGDLDRLVEFFADAGSMSRGASGVERPLRDTRIWLAEPADPPAHGPNPIFATALTNAEVSDRAMIGGVYTPPAYRRRGLSMAVCAGLCADLFEDAKQPVLYWENPAAGSVYDRLGFRHLGVWRSVDLKAAVPPGVNGP